MNEEFIRNKYLGVPFKHRGRLTDGLDCYGLIIRVYEDLGIKLFDIEEEYDPDWAWKGRNLFIENYHKEWERVDKPSLFDVVLFCVNNKSIANHGGVVLKDGYFLHSCKAGTVVSPLSDWSKYFEGYYHYKKR